MIAAATDFAALAARLADRARTLAEARLAARAPAPGDARRWRRAGLLWPLFTKG